MDWFLIIGKATQSKRVSSNSNWLEKQFQSLTWINKNSSDHKEKDSRQLTQRNIYVYLSLAWQRYYGHQMCVCVWKMFLRKRCAQLTVHTSCWGPPGAPQIMWQGAGGKIQGWPSQKWSFKSVQCLQPLAHKFNAFILKIKKWPLIQRSSPFRSVKVGLTRWCAESQEQMPICLYIYSLT